MITVYEMKTCPDCIAIEDIISDSTRFKRIDIGEHVSHLREFLRLRDTHPAFEEARNEGYIGIPCFVREDGSVEFDVCFTPVHRPS